MPDALAQLGGLTVPWVELFIGCALVLGIFSRFAYAISIPLTSSFIIINIYGLLHPVGDNCAVCFGQVISLSYPVALLLDCVMLAIALLLLFCKVGEGFLSIGPLLSKYNLGSGRRERFIFEKVSKLAVITLVMVIAMSSIGGGAQVSLGTEIDRALEQGKPVFIYFYAERCPPCEAVEPIIKELEYEYDDRIAFKHIDYWEAPQAVKGFGVEKTPTMLLITGKNDKGEYIVYQRFDKNTDKGMLRDSFEQVLQSSK